MTKLRRTYFTMSDCKIDLTKLVDATNLGLKLANLLTEKYKNNWITYTDACVMDYVPIEDSIPDPVRVDDWVSKFKTTYAETKEYYTTLIEALDNQSSNLLGPVKNKNTNKFNDTPQQYSNGTYDDDAYMTTVSTFTNESDGGTPIARLDELHQKLFNAFNEWCREFRNLFGLNILY